MPDSSYSLNFDNGQYQLLSFAAPHPLGKKSVGWVPSFTVYAQGVNKNSQAPVSPSQKPSYQEMNLKNVNIYTIENSQANVGARIMALENLYRMDPSPLIAFMQRGEDGAIFAATVLDLTRHSDLELAYWDKSLAKKLHIETFVKKRLISKDPNARYDTKIVLTLRCSKACTRRPNEGSGACHTEAFFGVTDMPTPMWHI